tara:strand:- start:17050 stop:17421 length:372 start_codon:yes stop_codon:yes gene_type:complete
MKRYKVRFHLARGKNYMKWQVHDLKQGVKDYYDPEETSLELKSCKLGNHPKTAQRIYEGENKTVCAWVACEDVIVHTSTPSTNEMTHYKYNPRKNPHWFTDQNNNVDGRIMPSMVTSGRKLFS